MKLTVLLLTLSCLVMAPKIPAQVVNPYLERIQNRNQPKAPKIPGRWLDDADGYEEALELQQALGADIVIYFARLIPDDQKGLCRWFEKRGLKTGPMNRLLDDYIKVQITLPSKDEDEALAKKFRITHCPKLVVVQTNGFSRYVSPFDWPQGKPKLKGPEELADLVREASSPAYRTGH